MPHNLTVTIEDPLWERMRQHRDIRWSVVMKQAAQEKLEAMTRLEKLMKTKTLSEDEIEDFSVKLGKRITGRR